MDQLQAANPNVDCSDLGLGATLCIPAASMPDLRIKFSRILSALHSSATGHRRLLAQTALANAPFAPTMTEIMTQGVALSR